MIRFVFYLLGGSCLERGLEVGAHPTVIGQMTDGDQWTKVVRF